MSNGRNKYQSRENRSVVRKVLMREWDPIGVRHLPGAEHEYDSYVGEVYALLVHRRASAEELTAYLFDIATGQMGLAPTDELLDRSKQAADALIILRPQFQLH
jgi:hypothetical protein